MKSTLALILSFHLSVISGFTQIEHAIELEYYLTLSEKTFQKAPIYLEKNIIQGDYKYTIASLLDKDEYIITEEEENNSTNIYPKYLYRLKYNYKDKALEAHEPIILRSENITDLFAIVDSVSELKWNFTEKSKTLEGYRCILATTEFRCREYHAWFTPDIPIPYGPWKLHGLPGLIIEAYDKEKIRHYTLGTYAKIQKDDPLIYEIKNGEIKERLPINIVSDFYAKIKENLRAKHAIANTNMDCLNCKNVKSKMKIHTWECY